LAGLRFQKKYFIRLLYTFVHRRYEFYFSTRQTIAEALHFRVSPLHSRFVCDLSVTLFTNVRASYSSYYAPDVKVAAGLYIFDRIRNIITSRANELCVCVCVYVCICERGKASDWGRGKERTCGVQVRAIIIGGPPAHLLRRDI